MTLPSSLAKPRQEVRFPYDFALLYDKPFRYADSGMKGRGYWDTPRDGLSPDTIAHRLWYEQAQEEVDERIRQKARQRVAQVTHEAERQYALGELQGSARYGGTPTTIEGAEVLAGSAKLIGGVMRTQAGKQFLQSRLTARVRQLNRIDALYGNTELEALPERDKVLTEDDTYVEELGEFLDVVSDSVAEANFTKETVDAARGMERSLKKVGWRIPQNSITPMLRSVDRMLVALRNTYRIFGTQINYAPYSLSTERKKNLRQTFNILERVRGLLEYLTTKSTLSAQERKMALGAVLPKQRELVEQQRGRPIEGFRRARQLVAGYPERPSYEELLPIPGGEEFPEDA